MEVRPPPPFLPAPDSRRWHNRRPWDPLGFERSHRLGDPDWNRDAGWLLEQLVVHRPARPGALRDLIDLAIRETRSYRALRRGAGEPEESWSLRLESQWERVLIALDDYLALVDADRSAEYQREQTP